MHSRTNRNIRGIHSELLMCEEWYNTEPSSSPVYIHIYKKLSPTPKLMPFRPSSPRRNTNGSEKLTSNRAAG